MSFTREIAYHQQGRAPSVRSSHTDTDCLEIIQILSGEGCALLGNKTYPLSPGVLLFIDSSNIHSLNPKNEATYCRNKLIARRSMVEKALQAVGAQDLLELFIENGGTCFTVDPELTGQVDAIFRTVADEGGNPLVAFPAFMRLITVPTPQEKLPNQTFDPRVAKVIQYLHENYANPVTIDMLAEQAHISKFYLCRLFRASTGMSIIQYMNERRITAARQLLAHSRQPITTVAEDCGFGTPSHFCSLFRAAEGMTPRDYRTLHQGKKKRK